MGIDVLIPPITGSTPSTPGLRVEPMMAVENLTLSYNGVPAFEDVSLSVGCRRITALMGPSGCGKTSFLLCLNRLSDLLPACRVTGRVVVGGVDVRAAETEVDTLRRRVGMIFQKPNPFPLSIRKNIELPLKEHGIRGRDRLNEILETVLRDVGLWGEVKDRLGGSALTLSGGQQQRLCIARALALKPQVVMLDEPCSSLDPISSGVVEDLILSLRERYTVVIVTHNLAQARRIADDAALFWSVGGTGRLIEAGRCQQVFEAPTHPITAAYIRGARG